MEGPSRQRRPDRRRRRLGRSGRGNLYRHGWCRNEIFFENGLHGFGRGAFGMRLRPRHRRPGEIFVVFSARMLRDSDRAFVCLSRFRNVESVMAAQFDGHVFID